MVKQREWTEQTVVNELEQAVITIRRLPPLQSNGYVHTWPEIVRSPTEIANTEPKQLRLPPTPEMLASLERVFDWMQWLTVDERKLLWRRADHIHWKAIAREIGCDKVTAWRRWKAAIRKLVIWLTVWR